jgi:nitroreductase
VNAPQIDDLIRSRRTHKAFGPDTVPHDVLLELFELARWAPNHHLTDPWRFRVLGPNAREALKQAAEEHKPGSGGKLDRAPTLVVASARQSGDAEQDHEDVLATAVASYIVLLGAHARGLAGYWRTLPVIATPAGRAATGLPADELPIGLLHLGDPRQEQRVPDRAPVEEIAIFLD